MGCEQSDIMAFANQFDGNSQNNGNAPQTQQYYQQQARPQQHQQV